jgi:cobaltochelatase CobS
VPEVDEDYVFRPFELLRVLYAVMTNQRCYLHGHTGSGKTTLVEQVAARLTWPFMRVNFDSEITRMDLIGRDVLVNEGGVTSSKFVDGILPQMMSGPYIGCLDEIDFVRPDIAYVLQRAAEGNGLMLTEDGGRMVKPHKLFRMFATGNTVGQGDEYGMYQGSRPQSMAFLDRWTVWVKVDYLKPADRKRLISARLPKLPEVHAEKLNRYVTEHLEAFTKSKVMQPISPRGFLSLGQAMCAYLSFIDDEKKAVEEALETTMLDRATVNDRAVLKAISQRVWG